MAFRNLIISDLHPGNAGDYDIFAGAELLPALLARFESPSNLVYARHQRSPLIARCTGALLEEAPSGRGAKVSLIEMKNDRSLRSRCGTGADVGGRRQGSPAGPARALVDAAAGSGGLHTARRSGGAAAARGTGTDRHSRKDARAALGLPSAASLPIDLDELEDAISRLTLGESLNDLATKYGIDRVDLKRLAKIYTEAGRNALKKR